MKKLILILLVLSACVDHELKPAGPPPEASAFICQIPRHWTLASNYVIHPLPFQHQRGLTYTSSTYAGKGMPSNNIVTRVTNVGTTTIQVCSDLSCYGKATLQPGQSWTFGTTVSAKWCEPPPPDPTVATREIKITTTKCNAPVNGVYITSYSLQLISATNGHTVNSANLVTFNGVYMAGTCNF